MKKIKFIAAGLALALAVCSAFTIQKSGTFDATYQVTGTDGSYYSLGVNVTGETPGPNTYVCNTSSNPCVTDIISSDIVTRNGKQEIPMSDTGNLVNGDFQNNQ